MYVQYVYCYVYSVLVLRFVFIPFSYKQWHLNGESKSETEFGAPEGRSFGFNDTKYQWNRGHWKFLEEGDNGNLTGYNWADGADKFEDNMDTAYTTDFLVDRAIDFIDEQKEASRPFALFLSLPDPHGEYFCRMSHLL